MRKQSTNKLATAKRKAWKAFSEYIRRRDNGVCFTCGKKDDWKRTDAGHYIPGSVCGLVLYFSEINVNCQCTSCNRFKHGNLSEYALKLQRKHGEGVLEFLSATRVNSKGVIFTVEDYKKIEEEYKEKLKEYGE